MTPGITRATCVTWLKKDGKEVKNDSSRHVIQLGCRGTSLSGFHEVMCTNPRGGICGAGK